MALIALGTIAKVRLVDGVNVESLSRLPRKIAAWSRPEVVGEQARFNPGAAVHNCDAEFVGFGYFDEYEDRATPTTGQKLGARGDGALDAENNRWVYTVAAVDKSQGELDAELAAARAAKWAQMKKEREARIYTSTPLSVTIGAKTFGVDIRSDREYLVISGLTQVATLRAGEDPAPTFQFTDADNIVQELSVAEVQAMGLLVAQHQDDVHGYTRRLRPLIFDEAETDPAVIAAITWEDGYSMTSVELDQLDVTSSTHWE